MNEVFNDVFHALVIARDSHLVLTFRKIPIIGLDVAYLGHLREICELLKTIQVYISCVMEGIEFITFKVFGHGLVKADAEFAFIYGAVFYRAIAEAALG